MLAAAGNVVQQAASVACPGGQHGRVEPHCCRMQLEQLQRCKLTMAMLISACQHLAKVGRLGFDVVV